MAVTAPTPPTPPTAPVVPQVTLQDGGSVTTSTAPANGQTETTPESMARQAVAQGDGALSKTEQEAPQDAANGSPSSQTGQNEQGATMQAAQSNGQTQVQIDPQTAAALGLNADGKNAQDQQGQQTQAQAPAIPDGSGGHGALFWGVTILLLFAFGFLLLRVVLRRKAGADAFGAHDIRDIVSSISGGTSQTRGSEGSGDTYAGMTADAVLSAIHQEEEEEERVRLQRKQESERRRQALQAQRERERRKQESKVQQKPEKAPGIAPPIQRETEEKSRFDVQI